MPYITLIIGGSEAEFRQKSVLDQKKLLGDAIRKLTPDLSESNLRGNCIADNYKEAVTNSDVVLSPDPFGRTTYCILGYQLLKNTQNNEAQFIGYHNGVELHLFDTPITKKIDEFNFTQMREFAQKHPDSIVIAPTDTAQHLGEAAAANDRTITTGAGHGIFKNKGKVIRGMMSTKEDDDDKTPQGPK